MMSKLYLKVPRQVRLFVLLLIAMFLVYFVGRFLLAQTATVPESFTQARQQASLIAQDIVGMSKDSAMRVSAISTLNNDGKYAEALALVTQELERNRQIRDKAIALSEQLQAMTLNVSAIEPKTSAQAALGAVSTEVTLIGHLLTYNDYLNQLLGIIKGKIVRDPEALSSDVSELVKKINDESIVVNELNETFNDQLDTFDRGF
ncbi:MAG: hypothetical protein ACD_81C00218G0005 [uncultured bacterium]|uniref:DUF5667 domain-containing protein n=2 Tax=Candidatus Wolfeibacteriota TaxID=1752735 RepID=A0A0G1HB26_9BACT|nr:MAG: hypothetical protein ACD_81C00218G0005 [uncultured bacterium]KKR12787.1 MAG: hypothetical protein UT41_C0001G0331 [Candidatus Wolfebacteria bacterium GW2011_GWC2_39_22]KKT43718.1 MAG: hypothetical protein UW32_C0001G0310 [Candidatus Wolfebacteria bacterium GW2011_GWE2_44_13]HBI25551.1 hypothetical protein [Candidatus Wolfebacteria bacterium]